KGLRRDRGRHPEAHLRPEGAGMSVTVAKTAGFCFGVRRAVELAEQQAKQNGTIWAYGEIIHNMHEIRRLESCGVRTAQTLEEIPDGARVLIRAHGVPRAVYDT